MSGRRGFDPPAFLIRLVGSTGPETSLPIPERLDDWWTALLLAESHGVAGLMHEACGLAPPAVRQVLREIYIGQLARGRAAQAQWEEIEATHARAGIAVVPLKGLDLLERCYPDPGVRHVGDLDILVAPDRVEESRRICVRLGYRPLPAFASVQEEVVHSRRAHLCPMARPGGLPIEVHTCWLKDGRPPDLDRIAPGGRLSDEAAFFHVAAHLAGHMRLGSGLAKWWADLVRLARGLDPAVSGAALDLAKQGDCEQPFLRVLNTLRAHWVPSLGSGMQEVGGRVGEVRGRDDYYPRKSAPFTPAQLAAMRRPWGALGPRLAGRVGDLLGLPAGERLAYLRGLLSPPAEHRDWKAGSRAQAGRRPTRVPPSP